MKWNVIGLSEYVREVIDEADRFEEARELAREYRIAFGRGWLITVEAQ